MRGISAQTLFIANNNKRTLLNRKQGRAEETTDVVADEEEVVYTNFNQFGSSSVTR